METWFKEEQLYRLLSSYFSYSLNSSLERRDSQVESGTAQLSHGKNTHYSSLRTCGLCAQGKDLYILRNLLRELVWLSNA